ncbi:unnamed protein product [Ostreobium quekettii]|uniref:Uncharacterized protein n=1 Tax=Ostreobium quekettii TaxID=121088 RepID=A0A8S1J3A3_9CHLO|nr:unnamed protein product [Ostreobium quekettii]|eukprot:evm.model.scf_359.2 EVM.evm.TU.scf_359.2   scf_359:15281-16776(+)
MSAVGYLGRATGTLRLCNFRPLAPGAARWLSMEGLKEMPEREKAQEAVYFNKEEEKLLRGVLKKIKSQADKVDKHAAAGQDAADLSALKEIVHKYNMSQEDLAALLTWKHS